MEKVIETHRLPEAQLFIAKAIRCLCLERLCKMLDNPDRINNELDASQAGWVSYNTDAESLRTSSSQGIAEAKQLFAGLDQPTRQHKALRTQLEKINPGT